MRRGKSFFSNRIYSNWAYQPHPRTVFFLVFLNYFISVFEREREHEFGWAEEVRRKQERI